MNKTTPKWMDILPASSDRLSFEQLRNFKQFYSHINTHDMASAPPNIQRAYRAFRFLYFFALILIDEGRFPSLNRCWDDLRTRYSKLPIFDDAVFIESWIFMDFPITPDGRTVLEEFADFCASNPDAMTEFSPFIEAGRSSRLGLYQERVSTARTTKYKELFTDRVISTVQSVPDYVPGEVFLGRIFEFGGDRFLLGDPKNWPPSYERSLFDMVYDRLPGEANSTTEARYVKFMKLAGPYWMSCVCGNEDDEILRPDHWKSYHTVS